MQHDRQHRDARNKGAGAKLQDAATIPTGPLRRHAQHGKASVFGPAHREGLHESASECSRKSAIPAKLATCFGKLNNAMLQLYSYMLLCTAYASIIIHLSAIALDMLLIAGEEPVGLDPRRGM